MNNRQRLMATLVKQHLQRSHEASVYFMEQITPIYRWAHSTFSGHNIVGSEYLGFEYSGGQVVNGVRHEDVMNMSFNDTSLDLIVSNDVFEHVPDPYKGFEECYRVLKVGGKMLATMPFHSSSDVSVVRATLESGGVKHLLSPVHHGNPVSADGSLVFVDFGWDVLNVLRAVGFLDAHISVYASSEFGHLGEGLLIFECEKNGA